MYICFGVVDWWCYIRCVQLEYHLLLASIDRGLSQARMLPPSNNDKNITPPTPKKYKSYKLLPTSCSNHGQGCVEGI